MSELSGRASSILPEDIEKRLANIQQIIADLDQQKQDGENYVAKLKSDISDLENKISTAKAEHERIVSLQISKDLELKDKESKLNQRESALDVYANALKEKEDKILKYIAIFEKMKLTVGN